MTRSELFKAAHKLTRRTIQPGDDYRVTFGAALRHLYAQNRAQAVADKLHGQIIEEGAWWVRLVARVWAKGGHVRVYVNSHHRRPATYGYFDETGTFRASRCDFAEEIRALAA